MYYYHQLRLKSNLFSETFCELQRTHIVDLLRKHMHIMLAAQQITLQAESLTYLTESNGMISFSFDSLSNTDIDMSDTICTASIRYFDNITLDDPSQPVVSLDTASPKLSEFSIDLSASTSWCHPNNCLNLLSKPSPQIIAGLMEVPKNIHTVLLHTIMGRDVDDKVVIRINLLDNNGDIIDSLPSWIGHFNDFCQANLTQSDKITLGLMQHLLTGKEPTLSHILFDTIGSEDQLHFERLLNKNATLKDCTLFDDIE
jgi:hypothetical protein